MKFFLFFASGSYTSEVRFICNESMGIGEPKLLWVSTNFYFNEILNLNLLDIRIINVERSNKFSYMKILAIS